MERDKQADFLKGYACLLVIIGHVVLGVDNCGISVPGFFPIFEKFVWSFHTDLFMFLSGYVLTVTGGVLSKGGRVKFVLNKLAALGIPYIFFSCLYIAVNSITPGVNNSSSLSDIMRIWYRPTAQYWFIYALFWLFVIWGLASKLVRNNMLLTALLYALFIICKCFKFNLGFLDSCFNCVLAFGLGTCIKSLDISGVSKTLRALAVVFHTVLTVILIKCNLNSKLFIDDFLTVFGIFSSVCFISLVSELPPVSSALNFICRYSFPLYLLHTFFTAGVRIALLKVGLNSVPLHLATGTAAGILFPVVAAKIAQRSPYLNFFFYPLRSAKQIKAQRSH